MGTITSNSTSISISSIIINSIRTSISTSKQIWRKYCRNCSSDETNMDIVFCKDITNILQILCKYYANMMQILCKYCAYIILIFSGGEPVRTSYFKHIVLFQTFWLLTEYLHERFLELYAPLKNTRTYRPLF